MANLVPLSSSSIINKQSGQIVKSEKFLSPPKVINKKKILNQNSFELPNKKEPYLLESTLLKIEKKVIKIDKILKDTYTLRKKEENKKSKEKEKNYFAEKEKELEKRKPKVGISKFNIPSPPSLGLFGWIKNFIFNTLLGFLALKLIDHLPKLIKLIPIIMKVSDFVIDIGGKLLDGLVTFVDERYEAHDATKKFVKNFGGDEALKEFDKFSGIVQGVIEAGLIAAIAFGSSSMSDDRGDGGPGGRRGGRPGRDGAYRTNEAARRYAQRFGRDAAVNRFGQEGIKSLGGKYARSGVTNLARKGLVSLTGKGGAKAILKFTRPLFKRLPIIGGLLDFGLSVALGEPLGRAAFKAIGAGILGAIGAGFGGPLGAIIGGMAGDWAGGKLYDILFGGKTNQAKNQKIKKYAQGGSVSTRGGKIVNQAPKRTITRSKKKNIRRVSIIPKKIKPGNDVGGEKKINKIFPNPKDTKVINPFNYIKNVYDKTSSIPFFGPIFSIAIKTLSGDKPTDLDYKNAGSLLDSWMNSIFNTSIQRGGGKFAGGGIAESDMFMRSEDLTQVITKSVEESITKKVDDAINELKRQLNLKSYMMKETKTDVKDENIGVGDDSAAGIVFNALIAEGFTPNQAAGVVGNLMQESGGGTKNLDPNADNGTHHGIAQWDKQHRWPRLAAYIRSIGKDPNSIEGQAAGLIWEMKTHEKGAYESLKRANSVQEAAVVFLKEFERSGEVPGQAGYENRLKYASSISSEFAQRGTIMGSGDIESGTGGVMVKNERGTRLSGELGRFLKESGVGSWGSGVWQHPWFGGSERRSYASWHNVDRAIDIGGYWPEDQQKILAKVQEFNRKNNLRPVELLYGKPGTPKSDSHRDHVHVAYEEGGPTAPESHIARIAEKGREYVIDADSYEATEKVAPGVLDILNYDVKDIASLKKYMPSIIASLSKYASYEEGTEMIVVLNQNTSNLQDPNTTMKGSNQNLRFNSNSVNSNNVYMIEQTLAQI